MSELAGLPFLESLDNKQLRKKCLEYGLPNVPITDSSRKVLIRKLHEAMDPTAAAKSKTKKNKARETIHGSKVQQNNSSSQSDLSATEENTKENNNRNARAAHRRTLAVIPNNKKAEPTKYSTKTSNNPMEINNTFNSGAMPPPIAPAPKAAKNTHFKQSAYFNEPIANEQKTVHDVNNFVLQHQQQQPVNLSNNKNNQMPQSSQNYRTNIGAANFGTVDSTLYAQTTPPRAQIHRSPLGTSELFTTTNRDELNLNGNFGNLEHFTTHSHNNNYNNHETPIKRHVVTTTTIDNNYQSSLTKPIRLERLSSLSKSGVLTTSYSQEITPNSSVADLDEPEEDESNEEIDYDSDELEASDEESEGHYAFEEYEETEQLEAPFEKTTNLYPSLTGLTNDKLNKRSYKPTTELNYTKTKFINYEPQKQTYKIGQVKPMKKFSDTIDEPIETPYLSEFARKLENLKSRNIGPVISPTLSKSILDERVNYKYTTEKPRQTAYYNKQAPPKPRRALERAPQYSNGLRQYFETFFEEYQIKKYLITLLVVIAAVFIYVFFM